ncbi:MAG: SDR family oxidoreductase [Dehalococcoidia bacterium]|nr:SDR family oxidoreductase [Dehalococcoidia bacterium]
MHTLVAGGAGFIGSHLCDKLLALGHRVTAVDNLLTGSIDNIKHLLDNKDFQFIRHDVVESAPVLGGLDAIFHLASPASPVGYWTYPLETMLVNSTGTHNLLKLAAATGAKYLLTSTSEAYGDPLEHPQKESYRGNVNPVGPRSCYDEGKRYAEALSTLYVEKYGVDGRIVRIFNTYGPRNNPEDGRMVPNFVTQALTGKPVTIYGDGNQSRSLCYVSDMVEGLIKTMMTKEARGQVINLGNPDERTVLQVAMLIRELIGSSSPVEFLAGREEEVYRRCPDITRARQVLNWEPAVLLRDGLIKTVDWIREQLAITAANK